MHGKKLYSKAGIYQYIADMIHLVQLIHPNEGRRIALVDEARLILLDNHYSVYELAQEALKEGKKLGACIDASLSQGTLDYEKVYECKSDWQLLPAFDLPENPAACIVSGTGLTHKSSALNRQSMHQAEQHELTDSMQMYQWGVEGGKPSENSIGIQAEWFYKGQADVLRAHGEALEVPSFGEDGGEEPEVAGIYVVDSHGTPRRLGFCTANEFSDHKMEKKNYLYLAPSKLRNCAIGPELVLGHDFQDISGKVRIYREGKSIWTKEIHTGEKYMAHSLANLEYHHFKYPGHRIPFQAHVHFFGADAFSFGEQIQLEDKDLMEVHWEGMGRALRNTLHISSEKEKMFYIRKMEV
ncbi:AraD1 family protein [Catalinimonas alkaloidigena]|uniref:AraD1 family protein n=1 Tax=Catalinimonas alkaloidigena TaxID=1075417 RepID=UPI002404DFFC|nr:AraD1 family protein [Catalinimonas alkaloidigena]